MEGYDVIVAGGGISGSVAARFAAQYGFKTLLIEKFKTPRNKACSGVQWTYFEKIIGEKIPKEKLCTNELNKVEIVTPSGKTLKGKMRLLNFWRSTFDQWLNTVAEDAGAEFHDEASLRSFREERTKIIAEIRDEHGKVEVKTKYLIIADGLSSDARKKVRPQDYYTKVTGATMNYYVLGKIKMDPKMLYLFYNLDFSPLMFSWVYMKDDKWVIGTGADKNLLSYGERFFRYVKEKYDLHGEIGAKEGFSSTFRGLPYLGEGNTLFVGDAAGLIDFYRGMGMDNAAVSGRFAVKALLKAEEKDCSAVFPYKDLMKNMVKTLEANSKKQTLRYASNEQLEQSLSSLNLAKLGFLAIVGNNLNKILPAEKMFLLPL